MRKIFRSPIAKELPPLCEAKEVCKEHRSKLEPEWIHLGLSTTVYFSLSMKCKNQNGHKSEECSVAPVIEELPPLSEAEEEVRQVDQPGEDAHHPHRRGNLNKY